MEFFDPAGEFPQLHPTVDVWMVDVNPEQPLASLCENHVEEQRSDITEVNRSP